MTPTSDVSGRLLYSCPSLTTTVAQLTARQLSRSSMEATRQEWRQIAAN